MRVSLLFLIILVFLCSKDANYLQIVIATMKSLHNNSCKIIFLIGYLELLSER